MAVIAVKTVSFESGHIREMTILTHESGCVETIMHLSQAAKDSFTLTPEAAAWLAHYPRRVPIMKRIMLFVKRIFR